MFLINNVYSCYSSLRLSSRISMAAARLNYEIYFKEYLMEVLVLCVLSVSVVSIAGLVDHFRDLKGHLC